MTFKPPKIIALTGSIGSGKSTVADFMAAAGATIIDADLLSREAVIPGKAAYRAIVEHFGEKILNSDKTINRKALGALVFSDPKKLETLNSIVHPEVRVLFLKELERAKRSPANAIVYVVPLLFESKLTYDEINLIVVVACTKERALERIIKRDSCSREEAEARYDSQLPIEEKIKRADYVIRNDSDRDSLQQETNGVLNKILAQ